MSNIYQKMLAATAEIQTVNKNLTVQVTKTNSYKAVGELDILNAVKPIEEKHGIYSYPLSRKVIDTAVLESVSGDYVKKQLFMRIETIYRFVNVDDPKEYIDITSYGDGIDTGDKATGKAMTYCDKYALMKAYKISTGDDPDQNPSEPLKSVTATQGQLAVLERAYVGENLTKLLQMNKIDKLEDLPKDKASELISKLQRKG